MSFLRDKVSLNHAKLKPKDLEELRARFTIVKRQQGIVEHESAMLQMALNDESHHRDEIIKKYKLRAGKKYHFNLGNGYIHRPGKKPWEKAKPAHVGNGDGSGGVISKDAAKPSSNGDERKVKDAEPADAPID